MTAVRLSSSYVSASRTVAMAVRRCSRCRRRDQGPADDTRGCGRTPAGGDRNSGRGREHVSTRHVSAAALARRPSRGARAAPPASAPPPPRQRRTRRYRRCPLSNLAPMHVAACCTPAPSILHRARISSFHCGEGGGTGIQVTAARAGAQADAAASQRQLLPPAPSLPLPLRTWPPQSGDMRRCERSGRGPPRP